MPQNEYSKDYLQYGGQAIVEGVMMRSPRFFSVACLAPNGEIISRTEAIEKTWIGRQKWLKLPFLRGSLALLDSMALGAKAMRFASRIQLTAENASPSDTPAPEVPADGGTPAPAAVPAQPAQPDSIQNIAITSSLFIGIAFGLLLFFFLPNIFIEKLNAHNPNISPTQKNFEVELVKICLFFLYIWGIGRLDGIRRVFEFHGAEHKAINTLEALQPLDIEHTQLQTRFHPRCGTSFAVIVFLAGMLVFTFVPRYPIPHLHLLLNVIVRFAVEILILPLIAGISYELLRLAGRFRNQGLVNLLFKPGIWTQRLTTREPDSVQMQTALVALRNVIAAEKGELPAEELSAGIN